MLTNVKKFLYIKQFSSMIFFYIGKVRLVKFNLEVRTMVGNVGAYPMFNNYLGFVGLDDMYDFDYTSAYGGYSSYPNADAMSFTGSIFPGMGFGFMPYAGGGGYEQYYNQMMDYQNFNMQMQKQNILNNRNLELVANSPMEGVVRTAAILTEKITQNEQDQIQGALASYIEAVRQMYPDQDEASIKNRAATLYQQLYGVSLPQAIRDNGHSPFWHGLQKVLTGGAFNKTAPEDNISQITGQPPSKKAKISENTGKAVGWAALASGLFVAVRFAFKLLSKVK